MARKSRQINPLLEAVAASRSIYANERKMILEVLERGGPGQQAQAVLEWVETRRGMLALDEAQAVRGLRAAIEAEGEELEFMRPALERCALLAQELKTERRFLALIEAAARISA